uniref:Arsenite methyltransferase n=1 Tax=Candidatus Methanophaga sp. ANME-1 ERB7 TaxID=2759913 RepID=A0A7G9ZBZ7_9EURY|nr:arsenite methyltransferase [Methanosarcinales archaeon ANME-1 ERB7]
MDLEAHPFEVLEKAGIKRGKTVLDFGCGSGTYTIPAAKIVGEEGKVYALDKDKKVLDELMQKAESAGFGNIKRIDASGELKIPLQDESVDIVLLYDVFHSYYFSQVADRKKLLEEIYRVSKPDAFISVWPKHMESEAKEEIESANFYLEREYPGTLIHDNEDIEQGKVLNFRKKV